jgi:hypothetical protein
MLSSTCHIVWSLSGVSMVSKVFRRAHCPPCGGIEAGHPLQLLTRALVAEAHVVLMWSA